MQNKVSEKKSVDDIQAISSIILENYVAGGRKGKSVVMKPAFHKNAVIHGYFNENLFAGPIQLLFDWVDTNPPARDLEAQIVSVDLANTVATARIELFEWLGNHYTDQFALLKENDKWKITAKVFHLY